MMSSLFLLIIQLIIILLIHIVKAQNLSDNTEGIPSITNFQPSLAVVIGMLSLMFSITFILLLYAKFCHHSSSSLHMNTTTNHIQDGLIRSRSPASASSGLDKTVVESLPYFRFASLKGSRQGLECSVCLAKFEEVEILRLLPKCKHAFHMNCIDQWLEKHSTCPLCRHKVSPDDNISDQLPYSTSLRFLWNQPDLMREDSNLELYVEREEEINRHGSSRFSIHHGSSIKEEELPIQQSMDSDNEKPLHKFNHKIVVSDVVLKYRWSNVTSSDLMFLNFEMLNDASSARFSCLDSRNYEQMMNIKQEMERKRGFENSCALPTTSSDYRQENSRLFESKPIDKRSMSEIIVHPRFISDLRIKDSGNNVEEEERIRKLWLPIARKTVQWFANRESRPPHSSESFV